jgi:hypothetical protein
MNISGTSADDRRSQDRHSSNYDKNSFFHFSPEPARGRHNSFFHTNAYYSTVLIKYYSKIQGFYVFAALILSHK